MSKKKTVLFTANKDVAISFLNEIKKSREWYLLHLPLENYSFSVVDEDERLVKNKMDSLSFIIHGNLRNTRFFLKWVQKEDAFELVRDIVHLVTNQNSVDFLATYEIPAIMPREEARPIDIIEFLLRISREGTVLYPTTDQRDEEVPGLLQELEMPVIEFPVCREETLRPETLKKYRQKVANKDFDSVIFHSRSSVTRNQTAFSDLDFSELECISSGQAVSQKLRESGIKPSIEAHGSWRSLLSTITE